MHLFSFITGQHSAIDLQLAIIRYRAREIAAADHAGRPPLPPVPYEAGAWLLERARALGVLRSPPTPLLQGRHLVELGVAPGPEFGALLEAAYEAQLDGDLASLDDALAWARERTAGE